MLPLACVFSTGLLVGNRLDHDPHLGFAGKEGSGTLEGKHDQEMVWGISLSVDQSIHKKKNKLVLSLLRKKTSLILFLI